MMEQISKYIPDGKVVNMFYEWGKQIKDGIEGVSQSFNKGQFDQNKVLAMNRLMQDSEMRSFLKEATNRKIQ